MAENFAVTGSTGTLHVAVDNVDYVVTLNGGAGQDTYASIRLFCVPTKKSMEIGLSALIEMHADQFSA